jgi:hypothetical protein
MAAAFICAKTTDGPASRGALRVAVGAMAKYLFAACFQRAGSLCGQAADGAAAYDRS